MSEESGQQRYCGNCGAEIRSGMSFCVSCGTPLIAGPGEPGPTNPGPTPSDEPSPFDNLVTWLRQAGGNLRGTFSGIGTDGIRGLPRRAVGWFKDLSGIPKLVLVGLVLLVLLVVLSPVVMVVAIVLFGVSIIALIIRVRQSGSVKNWGMVAGASVVMVFAFGGISGALYGIGFGGEKDVAYDMVSEEVNRDGSPSYRVVSSANDLESLNLVAQEVQRELLQTEQGFIAFYGSRAGAESANIDDLVGGATIYEDEAQVRAHYADDDLPLSSEEVEQMVDVMAGNGYVLTTLTDGTMGMLPEMPDFMMEDRDTSSASPNSTASPDASPAASSDASPSASPDSDQVTFTGEIFGYAETFNYDGLSVTGTVVDWNGNHIMVIQDPMQGGGFMLGYPGEEVTVSGEYRGTVTTSDGGTYEAVMAESVE